MAQLLDIFGNYVSASNWRGNPKDIRNEVFQQYKKTLAPCQCRDIWEDQISRRGVAEADEDIDERCSCEYATRIVALQNHVDGQYDKIRAAFGRNSQGFATFLGNLVEQYSVILAASSVFWRSETLVVEKPPSGGGKKRDATRSSKKERSATKRPESSGGMLTGFLVRAGAEIFKEGSSTVVVQPVHDREDVIIGRCLNFLIRLEDGTTASIGRFLVPLIVISAKVYVDLTRLENVRAKAESAKRLFPRSLFLVAAQTNALGEERFCLDTTTPIPAAISPVDDVFFFRACRRQEYDGPDQKKGEPKHTYDLRTVQSRAAHPMQLQPMLDYARRVRLFLAAL